MSRCKYRSPNLLDIFSKMLTHHSTTHRGSPPIMLMLGKPTNALPERLPVEVFIPAKWMKQCNQHQPTHFVEMVNILIPPIEIVNDWGMVQRSCCTHVIRHLHVIDCSNNIQLFFQNRSGCPGAARLGAFGSARGQPVKNTRGQGADEERREPLSPGVLTLVKRNHDDT